ncbi:MAG: hypothetical protein LUI61_00175 [Firmicutes bacterium]|nr:hypothetical protein [Bacillota bacterium]
MNRQIKIASIFLSVVLTFMFMVSCMDSSADEETNAGTSVSGTEAESDAATETSAADSTDLDDFSSIVFDENITVEIVTENITSETKTIVYSVENGYSYNIFLGNGYCNMILYKSENGEYKRIALSDNYNGCAEFTYRIDSENSADNIELLVFDWYGELEAGNYVLVAEFSMRDGTANAMYAYADFTVE